MGFLISHCILEGKEFMGQSLLFWLYLCSLEMWSTPSGQIGGTSYWRGGVEALSLPRDQSVALLECLGLKYHPVAAWGAWLWTKSTQRTTEASSGKWCKSCPFLNITYRLYMPSYMAIWKPHFKIGETAGEWSQVHSANHSSPCCQPDTPPCTPVWLFIDSYPGF
jgi:hypothetical protein